MTLFDIVVLFLVCASVFLGVYRGFVISAIGILGFFSSILCTIFLFPLAMDIMLEYVGAGVLANVGSVVIAYIISRVAFWFICDYAVEIVRPFCKGIVDRASGMLLGLIRGVILSTIIFAVFGIVTSHSAVDAKNALEVFSKVKEEDYPNWLRKSNTFNMLYGVTMLTGDVCADSFISQRLESVSLHKTESSDSEESNDDSDDTKSSISDESIW